MTAAVTAHDASTVAQPDHATIRVHPERSVADEAAQFLSEGVVAHVAFVDDGRPVVIPMTYHVDAGEVRRLYLHGAHHSRLMAHLASGAPVCVSVTLADGLVYSRTALYHSVNYRSVVCFARAAARQPELDEQRALLHDMIARLYPGRTAGVHYEVTPDAHLRGTAFVALEVESWSAKARRGGPKGPHDATPDAPGTAGVLPIVSR